MKINAPDNNTNFGWRWPTHQIVTSIYTDKFPKLVKYKNQLAEFVVKPDFDELGFKGNNHFYYPPELFRPRESFLDFSGQNNSAARYEKHIFLFDKYVNRDNDKAMEHAGRALHFLQDVTQPQHIERGNFLKKWRDMNVHKEFEELASLDVFINNPKVVELDVTQNDFHDLFDEAVAITENIQPANSKNREKWFEIAQDGIANMKTVTLEFLRNVSDSLF